jgi:hypothetical protein
VIFLSVINVVCNSILALLGPFFFEILAAGVTMFGVFHDG